MNPSPQFIRATGWHLRHYCYFLQLSIAAETEDLPSLLNLKILVVIFWIAFLSSLDAMAPFQVGIILLDRP